MSRKSQMTDISSEFSPNEKAFIVWLATPEYERNIKSQSELAKELGLARETLSRWKARPEIATEVVRLKEKIFGATGLSKVIDSLAVRASRVKGDEIKEANEAAKMLLQWFYGQELGEGVNVSVQNTNQNTASTGLQIEVHPAREDGDNGEVDDALSTERRMDGNGTLQGGNGRASGRQE